MNSPSRPKILYLINSLELGGAEIGLANMVNRGIFSDFELSVISIWPPSEVFLKHHPQLAEAYSGSLLDHSNRNPLSLLRAVYNYFKISRGNPIALVITSLPQASLVARIYRIVARGPKIINFEHNENLGSKFAEFAMRLTAGAVDGVWADSNRTLSRARSSFLYSYKVRDAIVALQDIAPYLNAPLPDYSVTLRLDLLYVGRLSAQKNLFAAVAAAGQLQSEGVPVRLHIVGDGEERKQLDELATKVDFLIIHGPSYCWHTEWAGRPMIGLLVSHHEGLSLTGLQLMSMGFPIVTTAPGEVGRYTNDGADSWIASDASINSIAQAMNRAWNDRTKWRFRSECARRSAQTFDSNLLRDSDLAAKEMLRALHISANS